MQEKLPFSFPLLYRGWYNCPQGKTWLQIQATAWPAASIHFSPDTKQHQHCAGTFEATGTYDRKTRSLHFEPTGRWLSENPCRYISIPFTGVVSPDGRTYTGKVASPECGKFTLIKARALRLVPCASDCVGVSENKGYLILGSL